MGSGCGVVGLSAVGEQVLHARGLATHWASRSCTLHQPVLHTTRVKLMTATQLAHLLPWSVIVTTPAQRLKADGAGLIGISHLHEGGVNVKA